MPDPIILYQIEIHRQCKFARLSLDDLDAFLTRLEEVDQDRFWYAIQNLLIAAGNISKLLWPTTTGDSRRGRQLRELLNVEDTSPLALRTLRNHFEHFDERLDDWLRKTEHGFFVDSHIGHLGMLGDDKDRSEFLRNYNPDNNTITFRNEIHDLEAIRSAIKRIGESVLASLQKDPIGRHYV